MHISIRNLFSLIALVLGALLWAGCGATAEVSNSAGGRLNPALSEHQKEVLTSRANRDGADAPAPPTTKKSSANQSTYQAD